MAGFFQRYFWVFKIACLAISAGVIASAVNSVIGYSLAKSFRVADDAIGQITGEGLDDARDFSVANSANIFQARREKIGKVKPLDTRQPVRPQPSGDWKDAVVTSLPFRLIGTAAFPEDRLSLATIASSSQENESNLYSANECEENIYDETEAALLIAPQACNDLEGKAKIVKIEAERVYFYNNKEARYEYLELEGLKAPLVSMPPKNSNFGRKAENLQIDGIRKTGDGTYEIDREDFDKALANLSKIATQARAVPAYENGKPVGFRIFNIKSGSVFEKIGLKNGDIINRINGYDLSDPNKALELYPKLKTASQFSLDYKSNGASKSSEYTIR